MLLCEGFHLSSVPFAHRANMTEEYFTDRQDRYMLVPRCKAMADFCDGLITKLCSVSLRLTLDDTLESPAHLHPYLSPMDLYIEYAYNVVWGYYQQCLEQSQKTLNPGAVCQYAILLSPLWNCTCTTKGCNACNILRLKRAPKVNWNGDITAYFI